MRRQTIFNDNFWERARNASLRSMVHMGIMARKYEDMQKKYGGADLGDLAKFYRSMQEQYLQMTIEDEKRI